MPIVDVELVGPVPAEVGSGLARRIADGMGDTLDSRPQGTWVRLHFLAEQNYAENLDGGPEGIEPVFVSIPQAELPPEQQLAELAGGWQPPSASPAAVPAPMSTSCSNQQLSAVSPSVGNC